MPATMRRHYRPARRDRWVAVLLLAVATLLRPDITLPDITLPDIALAASDPTIRSAIIDYLEMATGQP
jgi:hypothetical protein